MRICSSVLALLFILLPGTQLLANASCPPTDYSVEQLLELRQAGFEVIDNGERNSLAVALMTCVGDPDPTIRDGVVFEGITQWLRGKKLSNATIDTLYTSLTAQIADKSDPNGFQQPFAALILSEVARTDRVKASFSPERRDELVDSAANYLSSVTDYRGFSDTEGWRHGVAHGSDLVLQLVLNPEINASHIKQLMTALAAQIAPAGDVFYIFGEPGRLARSAFYAHKNGGLDENWWANWYAAIGDPQPLATWSDAYSSSAGLAKRHNTLAFLLAMHLNASAADGEQAEALAAIVMKTIATVLGG